MTQLKQIVENHYLAILATALLVITSLAEMLEGTFPALEVIDPHHGVLFFGLFHSLRLFVEHAEQIENKVKAAVEKRITEVAKTHSVASRGAQGPSLHFPYFDKNQHPIHSGQVEPLPGMYAVKGQYIWDSWIVEIAGILHRYALSAPTDTDPNGRHEHAFIRHAISEDNGINWIDYGPAITPTNNGCWPNHVVWTSSVLAKESSGQEELLMFITGRSEEDGHLQRIGLCRSSDGFAFSPIKEILTPTETLGYDITEDDGVYAAWRDPFVIWDNKTATWHMLFSAKRKDADGKIVPTVGHATSQDDTLEQWTLQPPLVLPKYYHQLEVPYMIIRNDKYYLFVSTQNFPLAESNLEKQADYRGYVGTSIVGPWEPLYGDTDKIFGHQIYAPTLFEKTRGSGDWAAVSFFSADTPFPLTGTPIIDIVWDNDTPRFLFSEELNRCLGTNPDLDKTSN